MRHADPFARIDVANTWIIEAFDNLFCIILAEVITYKNFEIFVVLVYERFQAKIERIWPLACRDNNSKPCLFTVYCCLWVPYIVHRSNNLCIKMMRAADFPGDFGLACRR